MQIETAKAQHKSQHGGKTYYFCCDGCKKKFDQSPEKYLKSGKGDGGGSRHH
jgi:Cu+-exporting ATPase